MFLFLLKWLLRVFVTRFENWFRPLPLHIFLRTHLLNENNIILCTLLPCRRSYNNYYWRTCFVINTDYLLRTVIIILLSSLCEIMTHSVSWARVSTSRNISESRGLSRMRGRRDTVRVRGFEADCQANVLTTWSVVPHKRAGPKSPSVIDAHIPSHTLLGRITKFKQKKKPPDARTHSSRATTALGYSWTHYDATSR